jgi:hypothetical protein
MRSRVLTIAALVGSLFFAYSGSAQATVLYSNIAVRSGTGANAVNDGLDASFSTGNQGVDLTSITLKLYATNTLDTGSFVVTLLANSSNSPGKRITSSPLATILDSSLTTTASLVTLDSFPLISLAANTRYWVKVFNPNSATTPTTAYWAYVDSTNGIGVYNEYSNDGTYLVANNVSKTPFVMSVSAIPEPRSLALVFVGIVGTVLGLVKRKAP